MFHKDLLDRVGQELAQCYKENQLRIDYKKLSSFKLNLQFTTTQIAWFFALTKTPEETVDAIEWGASDLIKCVHDLENAFVILVEDFLKEQEADIRDDVPWEESIITRVDGNPPIPTYIVSRPVFIRLFTIWISEKGDINPTKVKDMISRQQDSLEKARILGLHQRHLTDHLRSNLHIVCDNKLVRFSLDKIPDTIWLKDLAHYLAITAKGLNDYGDVDYDSSPLLQNAKRIHDMLWKKLKRKIKIYWTPFSYMKPEHQKLAEKLGVIQIERYGNNPERDFLDEWSVEVTKELACQLLKHLSEFNYLFDNEKNDSQEEGLSSDLQNTEIQKQLPRPSQNSRGKTRSLKLAIERLLTENPKMALIPTTLWHALLKKEGSDDYAIQSIQGANRNKNITFICGNNFDYHTAYAHIQGVIIY